MRKIGLYFGTFNPIHIGHIAIAGYMKEFTDLDEVWFVVSPHNPLKEKSTLLDDYQRLYMVQQALDGYDSFRASDIEFHLPKPSYTIDTLTYLKERHPSNTFCLIMGEDNLYTLHKWKNGDVLIKNYEIFVYPRVKASSSLSPEVESFLQHARIQRVEAPLIDIAGTFIRNGIKEGKEMSYFLPRAVWKYIDEMHFYEK